MPRYRIITAGDVNSRVSNPNPTMKINDLVQFLVNDAEIGATNLVQDKTCMDATTQAPVIKFESGLNDLQIGSKLAGRFGWRNGLKVGKV